MAREELSSLQMLEESAAQLAALRQRAESLLEQLASGADSASSRQEPEARSGITHQKAANADQQEADFASGPVRTVRPGILMIATQESEIWRCRLRQDPTVPRSDITSPAGRAAESHSSVPAFTSREHAAGHLNRRLCPTETQPVFHQRTKITPERSRAYGQSGPRFGWPVQRLKINSFQSKAFGSPSDSVLDSPVTVAPAARLAQVRSCSRISFV